MQKREKKVSRNKQNDDNEDLFRGNDGHSNDNPDDNDDAVAAELPSSDRTDPAELLGAAAPLLEPLPATLPEPPLNTEPEHEPAPQPSKETLRAMRKLSDYNAPGLQEKERPVRSRLRPREPKGQDRDRWK